MKKADENLAQKIGGRGVGDCVGAERHETHHLVLESEREAQAIAEFFFSKLTERVASKVRVVFWGEQTKRLRGKAMLRDDVAVIRLYPLGRTAGVLIHEIAHFGARGRWPHGRRFKDEQARLLSAWDDCRDEVEAMIAAIPKPKSVKPYSPSSPRQAVWVPTEEVEAPKVEKPKVEEPYSPEDDEVDDILEMIVDDAIDAAQCGVVCVMLIHKLMKQFGVVSKENAKLVKDLVRAAGIQVKLV